MARASTATERDLLRTPVIGALLRRRRLWQVALLVLSALLVLHGLLGPQLAPKNLSTLLVWVHYRGMLLVALLLLGNLMCLACPMMLVRDGARKLVRPFLSWPRALRGKRVGIAALVAVLFCYELFDWWGSPWATAWLILGYFAAAVLVDVVFRGASFCKSVCPIGQFNFVASALSPFEVRARDTAVCDGCRGHECITGTSPAPASTPQIAGRGCELGLFVPEKVGNMDCTLCLDCVRACPEDNVVLASQLPGAELFEARSSAGVGRRGERGDLALLALVFTFGALLNAFGMVSPVYALQRSIAEALGTSSEAAVLGILFVALLVVEPVLLLGAAAALCRRALPERRSLVDVVVRFAHGLVPLGVGVWAAHYGFHFLTGLWTFVPVAQKTVAELGVALLGEPKWGVGGLSESIVQPIELGLLLLGTAGSMLVCWRIAQREAPARPLAAFAPWGTLVVLLLVAAIWLLAQPMEMRGTFLGG